MLTDILRRGNIIGTFSNDSGIGLVEAIDPLSVHLAGNSNPDDTRDLYGIPIDPAWLEKLSFAQVNGQSWQHTRFSDCTVELCLSGWLFAIKNLKVPVNYLHELQNLFLDIKKEYLGPGTAQ